jgi:hypothetical protein
MTDYQIPLGDSGDDHLLLKAHPIFGNRLFFQDKRLRTSLFSPPKIMLEGTDGQKYEVQVRPGLVDPLPKVFVNGQEVSYVKRLQVWQYAIAALGLILAIVSIVIIGGIVGVAAGLAAAYLSVGIMRGIENKLLGAIAAIAVVGAAWLLWLIMVFLVASASY